MSNISKKDVLSVANRLCFYPTEAQVNEVIERFEEEAENDPTGSLELWIENLLYSIKPKQVIPPTYHSSNPKPTEQDQELIDKAIEQIKQDVSCGDITAIEELLMFVPVEYIKGFIPE